MFLVDSPSILRYASGSSINDYTISTPSFTTLILTLPTFLYLDDKFCNSLYDLQL
jgi:hypothetical protein